MSKMQLMLRKASHTLYVNGKMNFDEMHNYQMAVTEREVINGCLSIEKDVKDHIIIYTRIINNINMQNLKRASAFIDVADRKVDQEAIKLLAKYRDESLPKKMKEHNGIYKRYFIDNNLQPTALTFGRLATQETNHNIARCASVL